MSQYFIKRGEKIHGPFSTKQVKSGLESGKLKPQSQISTSQAGPWNPIGNRFQAVDSDDTPDFLVDSGSMPLDASFEEFPEIPAFIPAAEANPSADKSHGESRPESKEKVFKKAGATFEKAEETFEKFSLGFLINPRPFLSGSIYDYQNQDFPALAAAIRYYAFVTRIGYFIFLAGSFLWLIAAIAGGIFTGAAGLLEGEFLNLLLIPIVIVVFILVFVVLLLASNVYLILQLGFCEVARVLLKIELNTRT